MSSAERLDMPGTFKSPSLHGCGPASSGSLPSGGGHLTGSYQHPERVGSSGRPFDTAVVHKDSFSVKCARDTCFQGL